MQLLDGMIYNLGWFMLSFLLFGALSLVFYCNRQPLWRKDSLTDVFYWFLAPLLYSKIFMISVFSILIAWYGGDREQATHFIKHGLSPLSEWNIVLQAALILFVSDFIQYWIHRGFHKSGLWKYHAIHHSAKQVDWLTAARFHPINVILYSTVAAVITTLMGFSPAAFALLVPFNILYSGFVHANLNWTLGPLKYVFASPVFHRWHHTMPEEGGDKNFAPTFPFLDLMFGTFYMPEGKLPRHYGVREPVPEDFLGQLGYPFIKKE